MNTPDETMGAFVYCNQHLRVHSTGWCTVDPHNKIPMPGTTWEAAHAVAAHLGLHFFDGNRTWPMSTAERECFDLMDALAEVCRGRHPRSWLVDEACRVRRDRILRRLAEIRAGGAR